uniref:Uncharacterized protein n=1 Tax=Populus trichocarpa TaxID=3694 RepID=A0A3N7H3R8_POPTR|eukprot:XP_024464171.1 pheophorbide a oxygenase, chloroplastic isoform X1 [Populus trichocarpa]
MINVPIDLPLCQLPADLDKPEFSTVIIQHDLLYCYDTILENVSDPSQIDFSHHKVTGRRDRAKPLPFKVESSGSWGFAGTNDGNPRISAEFVAPCYYMNKWFQDGMNIGLQIRYMMEI